MSSRMSSRANVKPLTHWIIDKGYTVRFTAREAGAVEGVLTTPAGPLPFRYDATARIIHLPDRAVAINEYGWELDTPSPEAGSPT